MTACDTVENDADLGGKTGKKKENLNGRCPAPAGYELGLFITTGVKESLSRTVEFR